jgi:hypothetical protein
MATGMGRLVVGVGLDFAEYTRALTKMQAQTQRSIDGIKKAAVGIGAAFGTAISISAFKSLIQGTIDAADHLNDLSKKTGVAVEVLGGLGFAAKQAGGDLDSTAAGLGKLNKTIAEAAAGNKEAVEFFTALGINVRDSSGAIKDAGSVYVEVAGKFEKFADGPNKAALALRGFGKAGADQIPVLNEGARALQDNIDYYNRFGGVSTDTARKADQFNDTLGKISLLSSAFGKILTGELLRPMQNLADLWLRNKENGDQFRGMAEKIAAVIKGVATGAAFAALTVSALADKIGAFFAKAEALSRGDFKGFSAIGKAAEEELANTRKQFQDFYKAINDPSTTSVGQGVTVGINTGSGPRGARSDNKLPDAPGLPGDKDKKGPKGPKDDPTKRLLDNQLRAIQDAVDQERDLMQSRNRFLELFNQQGLLSVRDYYASRAVIQAEGTRAEVDGINKEIALLEAARDSKGRTKTDKAGDEGKIADLIAKRAAVERRAGEDSIEMAIRQAQAQEDLRRAFDGVRAQVLELGESFTEAAAIRFDQQFDVLKRTFTAEGNAAGLQAIDTLRAAAIAQAALQKAALDTSRTLDDLSRQEDRVALAQQTGATTSIEALAKVGAARKAMIPILEAQVAAEEAIARAALSAGSPGASAMVARAEEARLALDKLKASSDPLGESLNKTFGDVANGALEDFVTGTKTASEAFKSFSKGVLNEILKMGTKSITESIFGGSGGAGGWISSLFSGGTAGAASSTGSGAGGWASLLASFAGMFATGGTIQPGKWGIVGEQGPEPVFGGAAGKTVLPSSAMRGGGRNQNINVTVNGQQGMSKATAQQQGREIGVGIRQSLARND